MAVRGPAWPVVPEPPRTGPGAPSEVGDDGRPKGAHWRALLFLEELSLLSKADLLKPFGPQHSVVYVSSVFGVAVPVPQRRDAGCREQKSPSTAVGLLDLSRRFSFIKGRVHYGLGRSHALRHPPPSPTWEALAADLRLGVPLADAPGSQARDCPRVPSLGTAGNRASLLSERAGPRQLLDESLECACLGLWTREEGRS